MVPQAVEDARINAEINGYCSSHVSAPNHTVQAPSMFKCARINVVFIIELQHLIEAYLCIE